MVMGLRIVSERKPPGQYGGVRYPERLIVSFIAEDCLNPKAGRDFVTNTLIRESIAYRRAKGVVGSIRFELTRRRDSATFDWDSGFTLESGKGIATLLMYLGYATLHREIPSVKYIRDVKFHGNYRIPIQLQIFRLRQQIRKNIHAKLMIEKGYSFEQRLAMFDKIDQKKPPVIPLSKPRRVISTRKAGK